MCGSAALQKNLSTNLIQNVRREKYQIIKRTQLNGIVVERQNFKIENQFQAK